MIEFCHYPGGLVPLPTPQQATTTYDEPNLKQVCWQLINWPCFPFLCAIRGIRGPAPVDHERIFRQVTSRLVGTNILSGGRSKSPPRTLIRGGPLAGSRLRRDQGFSTYELQWRLELRRVGEPGRCRTLCQLRLQGSDKFPAMRSMRMHDVSAGESGRLPAVAVGAGPRACPDFGTHRGVPLRVD